MPPVPPPLLAARILAGAKRKRVGVMVARRKVSGAVPRNRIRRRVRAAAAKTGMVPRRPLIIVADRRAAEVSFDELVEAVRQIFRKYG